MRRLSAGAAVLAAALCAALPAAAEIDTSVSDALGRVESGAARPGDDAIAAKFLKAATPGMRARYPAGSTALRRLLANLPEAYAPLVVAFVAGDADRDAAFDELAGCLSSRTASVRRAAIEAIGESGHSRAAGLLSFIYDTSRDLDDQSLAVRGIARATACHHRVIAEAMASPYATLRQEARIAALSHGDDALVVRVLDAVAAAKWPNHEMLPALLHAMRDERVGLRAQLLEAYAQRQQTPDRSQRAMIEEIVSFPDAILDALRLEAQLNAGTRPPHEVRMAIAALVNLIRGFDARAVWPLAVQILKLHTGGAPVPRRIVELYWWMCDAYWDSSELQALLPALAGLSVADPTAFRFEARVDMTGGYRSRTEWIVARDALPPAARRGFDEEIRPLKLTADVAAIAKQIVELSDEDFRSACRAGSLEGPFTSAACRTHVLPLLESESVRTRRRATEVLSACPQALIDCADRAKQKTLEHGSSLTINGIRAAADLALSRRPNALQIITMHSYVTATLPATTAP